MEDHSWITYNERQFGWGYDDYRRYAFERKAPVTLPWVAVRKEYTTFIGVEGVDHDSLINDKLGDHYEHFRNRLDVERYGPDTYFFISMHD